MAALYLLVLLLLSTVCASIPIPHIPVPYSPHCSSTVPSSPAVVEITDHDPSFYYDFGHLSGGCELLGSDPVSHFEFFPMGVYRTKAPGILKVEVDLRVNGPPIPNSQETNIAGFQMYLSGFWDESSNELCMVGSGIGNYIIDGASHKFTSVLRLRYPKNSSLSEPLVTGNIESLDSPDSSSYFKPIRFGFLYKRHYVYTLIAEAERLGSRFGVAEESLMFTSGYEACSLLYNVTSTSLDFSVESDSRTAGGAIGDGRSFYMTQLVLRDIHCSLDGKLNLYIVLNRSDTDKVLISEGVWDASMRRFSLVACRTMIRDGGDAAPDCSVGVSLWFQATLSIKKRSFLVGEIFSLKGEADPGNFPPLRFGTTAGGGGLRYEYSKTEDARRICLRNTTKRLVEKFDPQVWSFKYMSLGSMRFSYRAVYGVGNALGYLEPRSIGGVVYNRFLVNNHQEWSLPLDGVMGDRYLNVSYVIHIHYLLQNATYGHDEISAICAEGVIDVETGTLCMVGCRPAPSQTDGADCEIEIHAELPLGNPGSGLIRTTRQRSDPLYFEPLVIEWEEQRNPDALSGYSDGI